MKFKLFLFSILLINNCKQLKKEEPTIPSKPIQKVEQKKVVVEEVTKNKTNNLLFSMKKMPCGGECIAYNIAVHNEGKVLFEGVENTLINHKKEFTLTKQQQEKLAILLSKTDFESYNSSFIDASMTDYPSTFMKHKEKEIEIKLWKHIPNDLIAVHEYLEEILLENKLIN